MAGLIPPTSGRIEVPADTRCDISIRNLVVREVSGQQPAAPGFSLFSDDHLYATTGHATLGSYSFSFSDFQGLAFFQEGPFPVRNSVGPAIVLAIPGPVNGSVLQTFFLGLAGGFTFDISNPPLNPFPLQPGAGFDVIFGSSDAIVDFFGNTSSFSVSVPDASNSAMLLGWAFAGLACFRARKDRDHRRLQFELQP